MWSVSRQLLSQGAAAPQPVNISEGSVTTVWDAEWYTREKDPPTHTYVLLQYLRAESNQINRVRGFSAPY